MISKEELERMKKLQETHSLQFIENDDGTVDIAIVCEDNEKTEEK